MSRASEPLKLSLQQRTALQALGRSPRKRLALRASIVLAVSEHGMTHAGVAEELSTVVTTVRRWRKRFEAEGIDGLADSPRAGAPKAALVLTQSQRAELERLVRRPRTNRHVAFRARIVLSCAEGLTNVCVAAKLRANPSTVGKWRKRFVTDGVDGLFDEQRPGAPRKISDEDVEDIIEKTLETKPKGRTHWSTRKMGEKAGVSHSTVGRIWRTFGLQLSVAQPCGALLRTADPARPEARVTHQRVGPQTRHPRIRRCPQRRGEAICLDEDRRPDPRQREALRSADHSGSWGVEPCLFG